MKIASKLHGIAIAAIIALAFAVCDTNGANEPDDTTPTFESKFYGKWELLSTSITIWTFSENHTFTHQEAGTYHQKGTWSAESPNKFNMTFTHRSPDGTSVATPAELVEREMPQVNEGEVEFVSDDHFIYYRKTLDGEPAPVEIEFVRVE